IANHNYDGIDQYHGATSIPAALNSYGLPLWETEVSVSTNYDGSITNALYWAGRVHQFLTAAQANAWHFWWLKPTSVNVDNGLTDISGNPAKRLYAMGNFSRFARPGFYRIGVTGTVGPALVSAYRDTNSGTFVIVAINNTATNFAETFYLSNFTASSVI